MSGADGVTPELRAPSIKGALRFWWRAMNGHLSLTELKKVEGEIFGDTGHRSKVIIREELENDNYKLLHYDGRSENSLLPHKGGSIAKCFPVNELSKFRINLCLVKDVKVILSTGEDYNFNHNNLCDLFKLICVLGGLGKRSRRGFGSIKINQTKLNGGDWEVFNMPQSVDEILELLGNQFSKNGDIINSIFNRRSFNFKDDYPYIKSIEIGETDSNITKKIIFDSHLVKDKEYDRAEQIAIDRNDYKTFFNTRTNKQDSKPNSIRYSNFENAIGNGSRFASPIFVSTIQTSGGLKSIITTLKAVPSGRFDEHIHGVLQTEYKNKLKNI